MDGRVVVVPVAGLVVDTAAEAAAVGQDLDQVEDGPVAAVVVGPRNLVAVGPVVVEAVLQRKSSKSYP